MPNYNNMLILLLYILITHLQKSSHGLAYLMIYLEPNRAWPLSLVGGGWLVVTVTSQLTTKAQKCIQKWTENKVSILQLEVWKNSSLFCYPQLSWCFQLLQLRIPNVMIPGNSKLLEKHAFQTSLPGAKLGYQYLDSQYNLLLWWNIPNIKWKTFRSPETCEKNVTSSIQHSNRIPYGYIPINKDVNH